ncbi:MAG: hypothetical protein QW350_02260 [Candidatus Aenigmatarchaeota archaeon]
MKKEYKKAYIFAAILSFVLYIFGIYTGIILQKNTENSIERKLDEIEKSIENTQLEYLYINSLGDKISCDALKTMVDETNKNLWIIGQELVKLESDSNNNRFMDLKAQYSLLSVRAWILNNYLKSKCKDDNIILLYFYSIPCKDCEKQGKILDDIRENELQDKIKIFVLDAGLNLPIINTLKNNYNVTTTPFIIFENKTFVGLTEKDKILRELSH